MLRRLFWGGIALVVIFSAGTLWISRNKPPMVRVTEERPRGIGFIKQCCLKDVRSTQEALTSLSEEAHKLRVRLSMKPAASQDPSTQKLLSELTVLTEQSRTLWDQLESLVDDPKENKRQQLRDIRINMEALKEHFQVAESCCGAPSGLFPPLMKEYLQIAAYRFGVVRNMLETSEASAAGA